MIKLVWVVQIGLEKVLWDNFKDAWADFKTHNDPYWLLSNKIYPRLVSEVYFESLKEHDGW